MARRRSHLAREGHSPPDTTALTHPQPHVGATGHPRRQQLQSPVPAPAVAPSRCAQLLTLCLAATSPVPDTRLGEREKWEGGKESLDHCWLQGPEALPLRECDLILVSDLPLEGVRTESQRARRCPLPSGGDSLAVGTERMSPSCLICSPCPQWRMVKGCHLSSPGQEAGRTPSSPRDSPRNSCHMVCGSS